MRKKPFKENYPRYGADDDQEYANSGRNGYRERKSLPEKKDNSKKDLSYAEGPSGSEFDDDDFI